MRLDLSFAHTGVPSQSSATAPSPPQFSRHSSDTRLEFPPSPSNQIFGRTVGYLSMCITDVFAASSRSSEVLFAKQEYLAGEHLALGHVVLGMF